MFETHNGEPHACIHLALAKSWLLARKGNRQPSMGCSCEALAKGLRTRAALTLAVTGCKLEGRVRAGERG